MPQANWIVFLSINKQVYVENFLWAKPHNENMATNYEEAISVIQELRVKITKQTFTTND